jgi:hypothetical protein
VRRQDLTKSKDDDDRILGKRASERLPNEGGA